MGSLPEGKIWKMVNLLYEVGGTDEVPPRALQAYRCGGELCTGSLRENQV
jgi:hypothetical protein